MMYYINLILLSKGDVSFRSESADVENSGYELSVGTKIQVQESISIFAETALTADKKITVRDDGESADVDYDYGFFDAIRVGLNVGI